MGHEASKLIIEEGGLVVAADVQSLEETRRAIEAELGGASFDERALLVKCDVSDEAQVENVCQAGLRHFGRIDGCIINAGVSTAWIPWIECPASHVENNFRCDKLTATSICISDRGLLCCSVNCLGAWLTAKHAVRAMIASPHGGQGGALVWVSSVASLYGEVRASRRHVLQDADSGILSVAAWRQSVYCGQDVYPGTQQNRRARVWQVRHKVKRHPAWRYQNAYDSDVRPVRGRVRLS